MTEGTPAPNTDDAPISVVEFTDPGCVWSWGSEPLLRWTRRHYGPQLRWRRAFGVQIDRLERTHPTRDAVRDAEAFRREWVDVANHTEAPAPDVLERMHRSTLPASYAARAAELQVTAAQPDLAEHVLRRLRESVFVHGRPTDSRERLLDALAGVSGLDLSRLLADLDSDAVIRSVHADQDEARRPHPSVIDRTGPGPNPGAARPDGDRLRYGFPTLLIEGPAGQQVVAGWNDRDSITAAFVAAGARPVDTDVPLDPDDALARYRTLTRPDLQLSTDGREPTRAVRIETATTPLWVHPDEIGPVGGRRSPEPAFQAVATTSDDSNSV